MNLNKLQSKNEFLSVKNYLVFNMSFYKTL